MRSTPIFLFFVALGACNQPRSTSYFEAHLDEARDVLASCRSGAARGEECANADLAVQMAEARARHDRFSGKE